MNLGIVGSRIFNDYTLLKTATLNILAEEEISIADVDTFVSGGAKGADFLGLKFATEHKIPKIIIHKPEWEKYGKSAGHIRNVFIVEDSDLIIAFWDGKSKGTKNTIELCKRREKNLYIINF